MEKCWPLLLRKISYSFLSLCPLFLRLQLPVYHSVWCHPMKCFGVCGRLAVATRPLIPSSALSSLPGGPPGGNLISQSVFSPLHFPSSSFSCLPVLSPLCSCFSLNPWASFMKSSLKCFRANSNIAVTAGSVSLDRFLFRLRVTFYCFSRLVIFDWIPNITNARYWVVGFGCLPLKRVGIYFGRYRSSYVKGTLIPWRLGFHCCQGRSGLALPWGSL